MFYKNNFKISYLFLFIFVLSISTTLNTSLYANSLNITDIEVSDDFDLNFNKRRVFDKGFKAAFDQLTSTIITSGDKTKIKRTNLSTIKSLINSFNISDENFINEKYYAKIDVNFNKKKTYKYFESKNIFPSIPKKINLLLLPILIDKNQEGIVYFSESPIYENWNEDIKKYHLLNYILPTEDIDDRKIFDMKIEFIEEYDFQEIIEKYDLKDYIILIVNQNKNTINILSKLQLNKSYKIFNFSYENISLYNEKDLKKLINDLKNSFEDEWKKLNLINTSIKLPITASLSSINFEKTKLFEETLNNLDLVSNFEVLSFNNKDIFYKIIYNGSPDKFIKEIKASGLDIVKEDQLWKVQ